MNKYILLLITFVVSLATMEASENSQIQKVTVYKTGARISRTATCKLSKGINKITFSNLSSYALASSIQIGLQKNVKLLSVNYRLNYLKDKTQSKELKILKDSITLLSYDIDWNYQKMKTLESEQKLIELNNKLGSTNESMKVEELIKLDKFYNERMLALAKQVFDLKQKDLKLKTIRTRLQNQVNQLTAGLTKTTGEITVEVVSELALNSYFEFSYIVNGVSWTPVYDMYSDGIDKEVKLVYKANVVQNTGINWKNVPLTISTSNPNTNNSRPILTPRYLTYYNVKTDYRKTPLLDKKVSYENTRLEMEALDEEGGGGGGRSFAPMKMIENQLNVEFEVEQKYNIPSNGKAHMVTMTDFKIPAEYEYHTVPIKDKGAYLLAKVTQWSKFSLLAGYANIFFDNTYIGQSYINPLITTDTLLLSFGRDERIIVKREKIFTECETKSVLGIKKHTFVYEISIRNTKSKDIKIEVLDQIPINNLKDVEVILEDKGGARHNEKTGGLLWNLDIKPNETIKVRFKYTVKHPKNKVLNNL